MIITDFPSRCRIRRLSGLRCGLSNWLKKRANFYRAVAYELSMDYGLRFQKFPPFLLTSALFILRLYTDICWAGSVGELQPINAGAVKTCGLRIAGDQNTLRF